MKEKAEIMDEKAVARAITRIAFEIIEKNHGAENLCIVGILSRGAELAARISAKISEVEGKSIEVGLLDITPHRDDRKGKELGQDQSLLNFEITDKKIILVDDVIYTGRSVRAAIDAIMSRGRPKNIQLAVLIDRGHRELPIRADYVGKNLPTASEETVKVQVKERDGIDRVAIFTNAEANSQ
ncbi:bifunctional pyr operon transcriptional regulator/uracil phosphoribosyltransferase PyrR [Acetanaerobacterium elongatum]|uniref:Bifunctional protein PyrR n=1 Tax=Acetanaerobacterium elongatum TaxID=258515 RepID=A0A1H0FPT1_9FIRM|nr:bifunctional pyr operon transcriptional regulator/uracil phosphoribosyltransferase PyrR [Acetanaerobacterium elongatum]SDN96655.1 pyrimidine operon attenuation protein / uracil phosphoribosyltransferase [Acetanaerobacterium elongatum]